MIKEGEPQRGVRFSTPKFWINGQEAVLQIRGCVFKEHGFADKVENYIIAIYECDIELQPGQIVDFKVATCLKDGVEVKEYKAFYEGRRQLLETDEYRGHSFVQLYPAKKVEFIPFEPLRKLFTKEMPS